MGKRGLKLARPAQARYLSSVLESKNLFAANDNFVKRHIGPSEKDIEQMLSTCEVKSLDEMMNLVVPDSIRSKSELNLPTNMGESEALTMFKNMMDKNKIYKSMIGAGYYDTITPSVILRNLLENPAWYTPYTPYQAEISQGRLEMLLNFQTMVGDLTGTGFANASLLDEATAAAEAMTMSVNMAKKNQTRFLLGTDLHPQTIEVVLSRAEHYDCDIELVDPAKMDFSKGDVIGILLQYPNTTGALIDYTDLIAAAKESNAKVIVASDLLASTVAKPAGEFGSDVVVGSSQRFGVPMGFGGPHAAFFACNQQFMRKMPGRVIGVSKDSRGKPALRMTMQTREQHIRRDKATSNICTAQALLANMAAAYGIYHGPEGLKQIGSKVHGMAKVTETGLKQLGYTSKHADYFDTLHIDTSDVGADKVIAAAAERKINLRKIDDNSVCISVDECTLAPDIDDLFAALAEVKGTSVPASVNAESLATSTDTTVSAKFARTSEFMTHPVFNSYHSETEMMRYLNKLASKDLGLQTAMIPLGSCTMKLNAASEMIPVTWPNVGRLHPFAPVEQVQGYMQMMQEMIDDLADITGFHTVSLQPNAGSQGEYLGLKVIAAYHKDNGEEHRNVCIIPVSAHGTNPASAVMAGMRVVTVKCDNLGNIDFDDLKAKVEKHSDNLSALMITYPSTHGVFESNVREVCDLIHQHGGQVYMDGANMNAQVGLCSPGGIGADVCHLNLHKTFSIPHGGGGPGMGPIGVAKQLAPFLPNHINAPTSGGDKPVRAITAAPFSSGSILPISFMYIRMMGGDGLKYASEVAILNANYMAARLREHFNILYTGENGFVAHEFILDLREFKKHGISEEDVAKRLQDYNLHAPTMSWPVVGTLMVEPTESESLEECDRLVDALVSIRGEIQEIIDGKADKDNNVLKNAPHTADMCLADDWDKPYPREKAAYPLRYLVNEKFWPTVGRLDNVYGDRNPVCSCPPLEAYEN